MSQLKLTVIADPSKFRAGMSTIQKDLRGLQRTANSVGKSMNKALSAVGLAAGIGALVGVLKNSAKAASEDIKSQALLANALKNTIGATEGTILSAEAYIKATQLSASVLDDELRPALATAVQATGSLSGGQRLLDAALNLSAAKSKDLGTVTSALSKAYDGNLGALKKLVPGLKLTDDVIGDVERGFAGAAETAAKNDPYKSISIIFADLQETIGMTLLPALETFSEYLASPKGQDNLQTIADLFGEIGLLISNATSFIFENIDAVLGVIAVVATLKGAWVLLTGAVKAYEFAVKVAKLETKLLRTALITTGIGALVVAVGFLAEAWINSTQSVDDYAQAQRDLEEQQFQEPTVPFGPGLGPNGEPYLALGYATYEEYAAAQDAAAAAIAKAAADKKKAAEEAAKKLRDALDTQMKKVKSVAESFRDSVGLAFGTFGNDENSVFSIDVVIAKMRRVATAAKGFAENIKKLASKKVPQAVIDQLVAMGPAQGNIVAKGLLSSGTKLSTFLGLQDTLYTGGASVAVAQGMTPNASYEININKAVITASDIIKEIRIYEKKTGRKYLVN